MPFVHPNQGIPANPASPQQEAQHTEQPTTSKWGAFKNKIKEFMHDRNIDFSFQPGQINRKESPLEQLNQLHQPTTSGVNISSTSAKAHISPKTMLDIHNRLGQAWQNGDRDKLTRINDLIGELRQTPEFPELFRLSQAVLEIENVLTQPGQPVNMRRAEQAAVYLQQWVQSVQHPTSHPPIIQSKILLQTIHEKLGVFADIKQLAQRTDHLHVQACSQQLALAIQRDEPIPAGFLQQLSALQPSSQIEALKQVALSYDMLFHFTQNTKDCPSLAKIFKAHQKLEKLQSQLHGDPVTASMTNEIQKLLDSSPMQKIGQLRTNHFTMIDTLNQYHDIRAAIQQEGHAPGPSQPSLHNAEGLVKKIEANQKAIAEMQSFANKINQLHLDPRTKAAWLRQAEIPSTLQSLIDNKAAYQLRTSDAICDILVDLYKALQQQPRNQATILQLIEGINPILAHHSFSQPLSPNSPSQVKAAVIAPDLYRLLDTPAMSSVQRMLTLLFPDMVDAMKATPPQPSHQNQPVTQAIATLLARGKAEKHAWQPLAVELKKLLRTFDNQQLQTPDAQSKKDLAMILKKSQLIYHPDKALDVDKDIATQIFRMINEAYNRYKM